MTSEKPAAHLSPLGRREFVQATTAAALVVAASGAASPAAAQDGKIEAQEHWAKKGNVDLYLYRKRRVGDGTASFGAGPAHPEDVRMQQDWDTAVAVATGELNAQEAFIDGRILLTGDQQKLLESQPVFGALDAVFSSVRAETDYH